MRPLYPSLACAVALTLSGCSSGSAADPARESSPSPSSSPTAATSRSVPNAVPSGRPGAPRGGRPPRPAPDDADAVGQAAVETLWTWDTDLDYSPQDAWRRAGVLLSSDARARLAVQTGGWGAQWNELASRRGWTSAAAALVPDLEVPDTATGRGRLYRVTVSPHSGDGSSLTPFTVQVAVSLVLEDGGWRVDQAVSAPVGS